MTTENKVRILSIITTRDDAGLHFTSRFNSTDLAELETEGLIEISRPIHTATGIPYSQEYWQVEVTQEGVTWVESYPEYCPSN